MSYMNNRSATPLARHIQAAPPPRPTMTMAEMAAQENAAVFGRRKKPRHHFPECHFPAILDAIRATPGITAQAISQRVGVHITTIMEASVELERTGQVVRKRPRGKSAAFRHFIAEDEA